MGTLPKQQATSVAYLSHEGAVRLARITRPDGATCCNPHWASLPGSAGRLLLGLAAVVEVFGQQIYCSALPGLWEPGRDGLGDEMRERITCRSCLCLMTSLWVLGLVLGFTTATFFARSRGLFCTSVLF